MLNNFDREIFTYGEVIALLYPGIEPQKAQERFKKFQASIRNAAERCGKRLELKVSGDKRQADARQVYFEGVLPDAEEEQKRTAAAIAPAKEHFIEANATIQSLDGQAAKPTVRFFVSYSHNKQDKKFKAELLAYLKPQFQLSKKYNYKLWEDNEILLNEDWHESIQQAIGNCDFGLLLLSHDFLISPYIKKHELRHFVSPNLGQPEIKKKAIPIALRKLDLELNLHGLESKQIYLFQDRAFSECRGDNVRNDYTSDLHKKIEKVLDHHFILPSEPVKITASPSSDREMFEKHHREHILRFEEKEKIISADGHVTHLDNTKEQAPTGASRVNAQQFLFGWANDPDSPPFCALLGEVGIGKTTNCKMLALTLTEHREADRKLPQVIYIDLRDARLTTEEQENIPPLSVILDRILQKSWQSGDSALSFDHHTIFRLVQQENALIIFDGLDEVLVHLKPMQGKAFIRELWRILPPAVIDRDESGAKTARHTGKLLLSCRSHYFRDIWQQNNFLTGEGRDSVDAKRYQACILLPFTDEQIRAYLDKNFPEKDNQRTLDLIKTIHNLPEMAQRPVTLHIIAQHIPELESKQARGETVRGVTLYRMMTQAWLHRDDGKHQFGIEHKLQLMEQLAAAMWQSGQKQWHVEALENWLIDTIMANPRWQFEYQAAGLDVLREDLRTATFIVREEQSAFRFSHTSIQEYFLACHLFRALREAKPEHWNLPMASQETLVFLLQLFETEYDPRCGDTLRSLLETNQRQATLMAFRVYLLAIETQLPLPQPVAIELPGQDLEHWVIRGQPGKPLNLPRANFSGSYLRHCRFEWVNLPHANFSGADALRAEWQHCHLPQADFRQAKLAGAVFRRSNVLHGDFTQVALHDSDWIDCAGSEAVIQQNPAKPVNRVSTAPALETAALAKQALFDWIPVQGHTSWVLHCAFSPDGQTIASASLDHSVKLWEARTGRLLASCGGHTGSVSHCAFSPDGQTIASASDDRSVKLWEARTGRLLASCDGHTGSVRHCAFSPDGQTIASASDDNSVKLWEARTGRLLASCDGHTGWVLHCAFSPDGQTIASASLDRSVKLWEAHTGRLLASCGGHTGSILHCAFSPDAQTIASASLDRSVKLWEARTGRLLASCDGHTGSVSHCAFSPDAQTIASASRDRSVKLWEARTGRLLASCDGHTSWVRHCAFSPDGQTIASASDDDSVKLWDAHTGRLLASCDGHTDWVSHCAFSPNGQTIASASRDRSVKLWEARTGRLLASCDGHTDWVSHCAFSPNGQTIASASDDRSVKLWDAHTGRLLASCGGHTGSIRHCAFSPDGQTIASASDDDSVKLWEARTGRLLASYDEHTGSVSHCAFSPDGQTIASASMDCTVRIWPAEKGVALQVLAHLPEHQWASWRADGHVIDNSPQAWRYLHISAIDPVTQRLRRYPVEALGALPHP
ncbi:pentapeptide repeat-containing protein [Nitrosomonas sp.]|uniref:WD40 domain-containing protein n=1 Tax=Nitrosomonas sp. TaxID=42353 RepID=UPI0032EE8A7E